MSDIRAVKRNISMQHWAAIITDLNTTDLTVKPEVPSFYTKDYVGAGISISS